MPIKHTNGTIINGNGNKTTGIETKKICNRNRLITDVLGCIVV